MSLPQTDTEIDGKASQKRRSNQMHSSHNLVCLYWHILDPFIIALTIATRIAIQFTRCLQYKWYSDNHHGLPVSRLSRCAACLGALSRCAACLGALSRCSRTVHGQRERRSRGAAWLAPARAPQILNTIAMLGSTERVDSGQPIR